MTALQKAREALSLELHARLDTEAALAKAQARSAANYDEAQRLRAKVKSLEEQFDTLRLICFELEEAIERAAEKLTKDAQSKAVTSHLAGDHLRTLAKHSRGARWRQDRDMQAAAQADGAAAEEENPF